MRVGDDLEDVGPRLSSRRSRLASPPATALGGSPLDVETLPTAWTVPRGKGRSTLASVELPWRLALMQAPIGPAATPELVAAVSSTGALGTLAASWTPIAELRAQVRRLRAASDAPFCVNLVLAFEQRERLQVALEEGARVVSLSWGVDRELIGLARDAGAFVLVQVGEADEAVDAVRSGADALIVQGVEAGGHVQATRPLAELLREIAPAVRVPVVAAGGIADAAGVRTLGTRGLPPWPAEPSSSPPRKRTSTPPTSTA